MSEISANIIVQPLDVTIQVTETPINITPEGINLNVYTSGGGGLPGGNTGELQYNNGLFAGIPNVTYANGNLTLTNIANLKIPGGTNGYFIQTDGTGNLTFAAGGGGGNGSPGGSNTQIQYNDNGVFGGNTGFTFNEVSGDVNIPGNLVVSGNVSGNLSVSNVANANYANFASNVITSAQPNITSLGTLTGVNVNGIANAIQFVSNIATGNAPLIVNSTTQVANLNADLLDGYQPSVLNVANTIVVRDANTNIVVGNVTANNINGNITVNTDYIRLGNAAGSNNQAGYSIAIGSNAASNSQGNTSVAIGVSAGANVQGANTVAIGFQSGYSQQGIESIAIGTMAGAGQQGNYNIAIGNSAGYSTQKSGAIAIGHLAGEYNQGNGAIAIGVNTGNTQGNNSVALGTQAASETQGIGAVAIGLNAGSNTQANGAIAIGANAAQGSLALAEKQDVGAISIGSGSCSDNGQGPYAIAIGFNAGKTNSRANSIAIGANILSTGNSCIILNATGANANNNTDNSFVVKPVRNLATTNLLYYDATTGEITYGTNTSNGGNAAGLSGQVQFNAANLLAGSANFTFDSITNTLSTDKLILNGNANVSNINVSSTVAAAIVSATTINADNINILGTATANIVRANNYVRINLTSFSSLPAASTVPGARAVINNGNTTSFYANVGGGGSNVVPVFSTGVVWKVG